MADITMCKGNDCPLKEKCHRYTSTPNEFYQSNFSIPPYNIHLRKCIMYWINGK